MPDTTIASQEEKILKYENFIENVRILHEGILNPKKYNLKKPNAKIYYYREDIKNISCIKEKFDELKQLIPKTNSNYYILKDLLGFYRDLLGDLQAKCDDKSDDKIYWKYITVESHFNMELSNIEIEDNLVLEPNVDAISYNGSNSELFKRKLLLQAFLNQYIFLDNEMLKMIVKPDIYNNEIKITASVKNVKHEFLIEDIPKPPFKFNELSVIFIELDKANLIKQFETMEEALFQAEADFGGTLNFTDYKHIIDMSIADYSETVDDMYKKSIRFKREINVHRKNCPNKLYDHLDSLNKLVKRNKLLKERNIGKGDPMMEAYRNYYDDENKKYIGCYEENEQVCRRCCAFLRICRYNCSPEARPKRIGNELFSTHLKPYRRGKDKELAGLSLSIYFRWDSDKIKIGYIGKHL